jgi:HSP20 family molecular chaperone IbpA
MNAFDVITRDLLSTYPPPRNSINNVDFTFKDSVYTATIDAAGADKSKFNVKVAKNGNLTVSYTGSDGYRCRPFAYTFSMGRVEVTESTADYVDGVLTVKVTVSRPNDTVTTITVN